MAVLVNKPPCVIYEDDHVLVVNKPAGINTHSPSPFAGEGIYEWLKNREPRWAELGIIHRLDKVTSGLMVFSETRLASRSLTDQFTNRVVQKNYFFLTATQAQKKRFTVRTAMVRAGEKYLAKEWRPGAEEAVTEFEYAGPQGAFYLWKARPLTGRTHQIRVHAQTAGIPILGDELYGGESFQRVCLHAGELHFEHPETRAALSFHSEADFLKDSAAEMRRLLIEPELTNTYRLIHERADGSSDLYLEKWGDYLLTQSESDLDAEQRNIIQPIAIELKAHGIYHKRLNKQVRKASQEEAAPALVSGGEAPEFFKVRENGITFEISFRQGYSVGLFLDQRENRRRLLTNYVAPGFAVFADGPKEVLNTFAYTCGFSVCAALSGSRTTSLDLSKKYLDWGRRNFEANRLNPDEHDFIYGDVFDWLGRLEKKRRRFDLILLDPPTFSQAKKGKRFQAEKDYGDLVTMVLPLLKKGGVLFASTNAQRLEPEEFLNTIRRSVADAKRRVEKMHYVPQPFDFPISKEDPAYLKTVWMQIE